MAAIIQSFPHFFLKRARKRITKIKRKRDAARLLRQSKHFRENFAAPLTPLGPQPTRSGNTGSLGH
jgi:hypothetical protein